MIGEDQTNIRSQNLDDDVLSLSDSPTLKQFSFEGISVSFLYFLRKYILWFEENLSPNIFWENIFFDLKKIYRLIYFKKIYYLEKIYRLIYFEKIYYLKKIYRLIYFEKIYYLKKIYRLIYFEKIYYLIWRKFICPIYFEEIYKSVLPISSSQDNDKSYVQDNNNKQQSGMGGLVPL